MNIDIIPISEQIAIILRQTNYDENTAKEKLVECNNDHIKVIKLYMGIIDKPKNNQKNIKSVNQEIYKQLRYKLNDSMQKYNEEQEKKLQLDIHNNNLSK